MSKLGMSRREARKRVEDDEFSWGDIRKILSDVRSEVERIQTNPSKVNPGLSISTAHNIFTRGITDQDGRVRRSGLEILAVNVLAEFGTSNGCMKRPKRRAVKVHHEPLIDEPTQS